MKSSIVKLYEWFSLKLKSSSYYYIFVNTKDPVPIFSVLFFLVRKSLFLEHLKSKRKKKCRIVFLSNETTVKEYNYCLTNSRLLMTVPAVTLILEHLFMSLIVIL